MSRSWLRKIRTNGYGGDAPAVKQFISSQNPENPMSQKLENIWLFTVIRLEELPDNKHGTTSGYHSAEWPVAGSKEEHSQCWIISNAIGVCHSLKNNTEHGACHWYQPGKVLSSATLHRHWKSSLGNYYPKRMILLTRKQPAELQLWQTNWI